MCIRDSYWMDGSILGIVNTGSVNNDGNGQGVRFDVWHSYNGSMTYVFSDFSQGEGDDVHLFRYRQSLFKNKLNTGLFFQRKLYSNGGKFDYNEHLMNFSKKLEETCIETVESGKMTKDLAILISQDQKWLNTQDFLNTLKDNLERKLET